jgi:hypothetical protein
MVYNVDIIMCIDLTGSMTPYLAEVKANALKLYPDLKAQLDAKGKPVDQVRIKVIGFGDFGCDGPKALQQSEFFTLSDNSGMGREQFNAFIHDLEQVGGGDIPEDSLEALAIAFNSDWVRTGDKQRHVVALWTDAPPNPLGKNAGSPNYPTGMPSSLDELIDQWNDPQGRLNAKSKRLLLFAPTDPTYQKLKESMEQIAYLESKAGTGCDETSYAAIIGFLEGTI